MLITADLHYDIARSRRPTEGLARRVCAQQADALVLVGDTAGADLSVLQACLGLFKEFTGRKLLVLGNHCLWCRGRENSLDRYERLVPQAAAEAGFGVLDHRPAVLGRVGLVGSVGWYDYSFRDESLAIPAPFYGAKVAPGAAAYLGDYGDLLEAHRDELTEEHMSISSRWMDGVNVRLGMSDAEFLEMLAAKLARQISEMASEVDRVAAFLHHLPFREMVPQGRPPRFAFAAAYMGADALGRVLLAAPKVTRVYCGHSHWKSTHKIRHLTVVNVGSTYTQKHLEVLDL